MQFINIVVHSVEDMNFRVHLQYEFTKLGLEEFLQVEPGSTETPDSPPSGASRSPQGLQLSVRGGDGHVARLHQPLWGPAPAALERGTIGRGGGDLRPRPAPAPSSQGWVKPWDRRFNLQANAERKGP